jgi:hypothetical protein
MKRRRFGRPLQGSYTCEPVLDGIGDNLIQHCYGPGIEECVQSYAQDVSGETRSDTQRVNIGLDWFGVGADRTSTVTFGGNRGYLEGCRLAEEEAITICDRDVNSCRDAAGGCP